jgi:hypothetical protein
LTTYLIMAVHGPLGSVYAGLGITIPIGQEIVEIENEASLDFVVSKSLLSWDDFDVELEAGGSISIGKQSIPGNPTLVVSRTWPY